MTAAASGDGDVTGQWANDEGTWINANLNSLVGHGNALDDYVTNVLALLSAVADGSDQTDEVSALLAMRNDIALLAGLPIPAPVVTPAPPTKVTYANLSKRNWAKIVKAPDNYVGHGYQVWACISQFDAATGSDSFRAQASYRNEPYWYSDGVNAFFSGDEAKLADFVEGDIVFMSVLGGGSYSYDTQSGGNTTAPLFEVVKIQRKKGSC